MHEMYVVLDWLGSFSGSVLMLLFAHSPAID